MNIRRGKLLCILMLVVFSMVSIIGCGGGDKAGGDKDAKDDVIRIGLVYPLTGDLAKLGQEELKGAKIAAELRNAQGGINGKKIEWVVADTPTPDAAVAEAERLITVEKVPIIMGSYSSGVAFAGSAVAEKNKVIWWENSGVADKITQRGFRYLFRFGITGTSLGETQYQMLRDIVAPMINKDIKDCKIGIIYEDSAFGTSVAEGCEKLAKQEGCNIVVKEGYNAKTTDLSPLILKMKKAGVDVLAPTCYVSDGLLLFKQMKELNFKPAIVVGGNCTQDLKNAMGDGIEGLLHSDITMPRTAEAYAPGLEAFMKEYKNRHNAEPYSGHVIRAYAGANVLFDVIEKAGGTDPEKIVEAAMSLDIPKGSTPTGWGVKFAPDGDPMMHTNLNAQALGCVWYKGDPWTVWPKEATLPGVEIKPFKL